MTVKPGKVDVGDPGNQSTEIICWEPLGNMISILSYLPHLILSYSPFLPPFQPPESMLFLLPHI